MSNEQEDWVLCRVFSKRSDEGWSTSELENSNDDHGNHTNCSSSSSSSASLFGLQTTSIPVTGYYNDQLPPFNVDLQTQEENKSFMNLARLHCNLLEETEYISSFTGFTNEDDHGSMLGMGLEVYPHYGSGIDNVCWETNLVEDMTNSR